MHAYIHTLHYITLHYITLHYITLHYITLHYLQYSTVQYSTVQYITYIQHNLSIHNLLTLTLPHTTYSTPILHHLFSLSCFPHAIFTFLLLLVGRSWHVGLSGALIHSSNSIAIMNNNDTRLTRRLHLSQITFGDLIRILKLRAMRLGLQAKQDIQKWRSSKI